MVTKLCLFSLYLYCPVRLQYFNIRPSKARSWRGVNALSRQAYPGSIPYYKRYSGYDASYAFKRTPVPQQQTEGPVEQVWPQPANPAENAG